MSQAFVVTSALVGALIISAAPPASAVEGGSCSVAMPATVSIAKPYTLIPATLGADCAASGADYAVWDVGHSSFGPIDSLIFDQTTSDSFAFYDSDHYGTYYVEPAFALDSADNVLTQNERSFAVKLDSRLGITAARAGSYVTLNVTASYYSPTANAFRPWNKDRVLLQYRTPGTTTWRYLTTRITTSNGKASYRVLAPKGRYYRAGSYATSTIWGQASATVYR